MPYGVAKEKMTGGCLGALAAGAVYALSLLFPEGEAFDLLFYFLLAGAATLGAQALFRLFRI